MIEFVADDDLVPEAQTEQASDRWRVLTVGSQTEVVDENGRSVARGCGNSEEQRQRRAKQIADEHNSHASLVAALRGLLDTVTGMQDQGAKTYSGDKKRITAAEAALKAAGEEV